VQVVTRTDFLPVEEYLAAEAESEVRHEYLGGLVYAMAGETRDHNTILLNLAAMLREKLRGGPCNVYASGIRVNLFIRSDEYYYYPDVVVTCEKRDTDKRVVRYPKLIVEVLSESTERIDRREKFFAYTNLDSLEEYLLVPQDIRELTVFRRANDWKAETFNDSLHLESLNIDLPISSVYEGI
jgi:Uma2 family endonuclease